MKQLLLLLALTLGGLEAYAQSVVINELMPANVDMFVDPTWNYGSWMEIYNPTEEAIDMGGWYVSDDAADLRKARIPKSVGKVKADGYRVLWFDHTDTRKDIGEGWKNTNLNMKLDPEGGTVFLSDGSGTLIASQTYPAAFMRCAYARKGDGWLWTASPTPGAANTTSVFPLNQTALEAPEVDLDGQLFTSPLTVKVVVPVGTKLAYTTDGSTPTPSSPHIVTNTSTTKPFTRSFRVSTTTVYRFRLFSKGNLYLPSPVVTRSYIYKDKDYYLPVVSLTTDSLNLYSDTMGIYVSGTNGKTANQDGTKRNFNMEWERPVNFEFIDNQDGGYFCQEVDCAINGGWSRKYEPRSFKLKAAKIYSLKNSLDYAFFADKPYNKLKSVILRNGGNDEYNQTRLKDAALQEVARQSGFPLNLQSYRPCHVFLDGHYIGLLNMREPSNKHYASANYGADTDLLDAFEMSVDSGYVQKAGTKEAFNRWYSLAQNAADAMAYAQLCDLVDIDDFTNYMAFKFFLNDWDWPHNNYKAFRARPDGRFHSVVFDLDNCVDRVGNNIFQDFESKRTHTFYTRPEYGWTALTKEVELVTIFLNMLSNEQFRRRFIDTYCLVGGTTFGDEERIERIVNDMAAHIQTALSWEGHTPYGTGRSFAGGIINALTGDLRERMTQALKAYSRFHLQTTEPQEAVISANTDGAQLTLNGLPIPQGRFHGYVFAPASLSAKPLAGMRFAGWQTAEGALTTTTLFPTASEWKYYQGGSLDGKAWTSPSYSTASWATASAPFGYAGTGKPMAAATTTLTRHIPTIYFRKTFNLTDTPQTGDIYTLHYEVDDGMIVYVNGREAGLYHMWSGATYEQTCQSTGQSWYEGDTPASGTIDIPADLLHKGTNTLAIELHNCNSTSSDLWLDASLTLSRPSTDEGSFVSTDTTYTLPTSGSIALTAVYTPLPEDESPAAVRINEVSAGNSIYVDDYFKKDDWVELYNTTSEDYNLGGCFLTDSRLSPHKYELPEAVIPAHGYKIVWCSKRERQGEELHAPFKLANADGEFVRLEAADGAWADTLVYCLHKGTESVGRYPDGADSLFLMASPTIGGANRLTSYARTWTAPADTTTHDAIRRVETEMSQAGISLALRGDALEIASDAATTATLYIYTTAGQVVATYPLSLTATPQRVSLRTLPRGIYLGVVGKRTLKIKL